MADWTVDKTSDQGFALPWSAERISVLRRTIDFTVDSLVTTGTMPIFKIPANSIVLAAGIKVLTADAQISDLDFGLATESSDTVTVVDADCFGDAFDPSSTGYKVDPDAVYNCYGTSGFTVIAVDSYMYITVKTSATLNDAVITFYAVVANIT